MNASQKRYEEIPTPGRSEIWYLKHQEYEEMVSVFQNCVFQKRTWRIGKTGSCIVLQLAYLTILCTTVVVSLISVLVVSFVLENDLSADRKEVGRIVEQTKKSIEVDLVDILY